MLPLGEAERGSLVLEVVEVTEAGEAGGLLPPFVTGDFSLSILPCSDAGEAGEGKESGSLVNRVKRENTPFFGSHWKYLIPATDPSFFPTIFTHYCI